MTRNAAAAFYSNPANYYRVGRRIYCCQTTVATFCSACKAALALHDLRKGRDWRRHLAS